MYDLYQRRIKRCDRNHELAPFAYFQTSFFAARSVLWAAFKNTVVTAELNTRQKSVLNTRWEFDGKEYRGVLLIQFSTQTPALTGLTSMTLDNNNIEEWSQEVQRYFETGHTDNTTAWSTPELEAIHKKTAPGLSTWPDIIHAPEISRNIEVLDAWEGPTRFGLLRPPIWRSAHCSEGAFNALNNGRCCKLWRLLFVVTLE